MKQPVLFFILLVGLMAPSMAQTSDNQINIGFDAGGVLNEYYAVQFPAGIGFSVKGLIGMPMNAWLSLSGNYLYFPIDSDYILPNGRSISLHQIPLFAGYRVLRQQFFFEPQIGTLLMINNDNNVANNYTEKKIQFAFAAEIGYIFNRMEFSLRYQHSGASPFHMAFLGARAVYSIRGL
jgi:hypothetical protein